MAAGEVADGTTNGPVPADPAAPSVEPAFCSSLPESVRRLLQLVDDVWAESGQASARSSSSSSSSSLTNRADEAPTINAPPPGLEGAPNPPEKFVRRVSRQRLLLPEQQQRLQSVPQNYHSTLRDKLRTAPTRSVTIADPEEVEWAPAPPQPRGSTRRFPGVFSFGQGKWRRSGQAARHKHKHREISRQACPKAQRPHALLHLGGSASFAARCREG